MLTSSNHANVSRGSFTGGFFVCNHAGLVINKFSNLGQSVSLEAAATPQEREAFICVRGRE